MTEKKTRPPAPKQPDSIITTQKNGQTIVAELFFNHSSTETFRDKLLKAILADSSLYLRLTVKSRKKRKSCDNSRPDDTFPSGRFLSEKTPFSPSQEPEKTPAKMPLLRNRGAERRVYANRAYQAKKDHRYLV